MMRGAVFFFTNHLGWIEDTESRVEGDWGCARFVRPKNQKVRVQLTEELDHPDDPAILPGAHLGIKVFDADLTAHEVEKWAGFAGMTARIEPANKERTKWFVEIPALFTFKLEFISVG
jgi:hypothetical protein